MYNLILIACGLLFYFLGASIGSFGLVTVMRGHRKEDWVKSRSCCENCGYELNWWELIPTFSYLMLGGKCSKCKAKINPIHFISETGLGLVYLGIYLRFIISHYSLVFLMCTAVAATVLWITAMSDTLYYEVHSLPIYVTALFIGLFSHRLIITAILIGIDIVVFSKDNFKYLGAGDIDVLILIYAALGKALPLVSVLFYASLTALIAYKLVISKRENKQIPFVPFLFIGYIMTALVYVIL